MTSVVASAMPVIPATEATEVSMFKDLIVPDLIVSNFDDDDEVIERFHPAAALTSGSSSSSPGGKIKKLTDEIVNGELVEVEEEDYDDVDAFATDDDTVVEPPA